MSMKILIVEDNKLQAETLAVLLDKAGYWAKVALSGIAALNLMKNKLRPSVILLDIHLPIMSGDIMIQELEQYHVPIIVMTADTKWTTTNPAIKIIRKPFKIDDLVKILSEYKIKRSEPLIDLGPSHDRSERSK